jgi:tetraacyldisaccharide 4'-kinase
MVPWTNPVIAFLLRPASFLYGGVMRWRNRLYDRGVLTSHGVDAIVISVGNITVGGTGKTPFVIHLADWLKGQGVPTAVLSRGYGRNTRGLVVVSDGRRLRSDAVRAGDEPVLLARRLGGVPVVVCGDRVRAGRFAVQEYASRVLVLDDAFQHRRILRNLDIVLLNAERPFGNGRLLPGGPLREPLAGLARADLLVVTGVGESPVSLDIPVFREHPPAAVLYVRRVPRAWISLPDWNTLPLDRMQGKRVLAFAGIGNPASFERTVSETGAAVVRCLGFRDHHPYGFRDVERIARAAVQMGVHAVVTTEKDAVRFTVPWPGGIPWVALRIGMEWIGSTDALVRALRALGLTVGSSVVY